MIQEDLTFQKNLHIFNYHDTFFAFEPTTVCLTHINRDESTFLKACRQVDNIIDVSSFLSWDLSYVKKVRESLTRKGLLSPFPLNHVDINPPTKRVEVLVNVSQICNLKCDYCFVKQGKFKYNENRLQKLSPKNAKRLIEVLSEGFPWAIEFSIHFYGGEPLLNLPAIKAAVETARGINNFHFTFSITTNGTVYSEEIISILKHANFNVILSIDGPAPIHDAIRRTINDEPTHARVIKFLKRLRSDTKLHVRASSVVHRGWSLRQARRYLLNLDVDAIKAQIVRVPTDHFLAPNDLERKEYILHLTEVADEVIKGLKQKKAPLDDRFNQWVLQLLIGTRRTSFCGAGKWTFGLSADGTIFPCALLAGEKDMILGRLDDPVNTWVEKGQTWADLHSFQDKCRNCWAQPLCGGGCPAMLQIYREKECELIKKNCELALAIYGAFYPNNLENLLYLMI